MKTLSWWVFIILISPLIIHAQGRTPGLDSIKQIKPGASLVLVSSQFVFTEGPTVDKSGNVYFTDQPNNKIWLYKTDGTLSVFMDKAGRSNGLYMDKDGNILACADEKNELWSIDPKGKITVLLNGFNGRKFNGPNDLWPDRKGGIYFTDPYYQRDYWERKKPDIEGQKVYYLGKGQKEAVVVAEDLMQPNGIVGTSNGKNLYVADIRGSKIYRYTINKDGKLSDKKLFASQGADGMTLDKQGNLYLAGRGVTIYNPDGKKLGTIPVPANWVGNLCFAGKDRSTLFITASEAVYTLEMAVKGVE